MLYYCQETGCATGFLEVGDRPGLIAMYRLTGCVRVVFFRQY
jgi:hypothetical protein